MKKNYLFTVIIGIAIILVAYLLGKVITNNTTKIEKNENSSKLNTTTNSIKNNTIPNGQIGIVSHKYNGYATIEVVIKNNTSKTLNSVEVKAKCYDKDDNNLGEYSGWQNNVNNKDTYKINVFCGSNMKRYELALNYN